MTEHTFHDAGIAAMAKLAKSTGAQMRMGTKSKGGGSSSNGSTQQQQLPPGALFRWPGMTARPRFVEETGPCQVGTTTTLAQATTTAAPYLKFQTLDIDLGFLLELDFTTTWTAGSGKTLLVHPFGIAQWVQSLSVQFESAYQTFRLPGVLALVMQSYRSIFASKQFYSSWLANSANIVPQFQLVDGSTGVPQLWQGATLSTPGLQLNLSTAGTQQSYKLFLEVPVSMYFDIYYELSASGQAVGPPATRAIVSPQRMAATTRNVTPKLTFGAGLSPQPVGVTGSGPASLASGDTTSTFTGTVNSSWFRDALIPSQSPLTEPPNRMWQYSRDYISFQTGGGSIIPVPLDDQVPGQGQILSLIFFTFDPALQSSTGYITPAANYTTVELLYGSTVQIFQDTPQTNVYRWTQIHGAVLPSGMFGWDLMLTEDGRTSNEFAINTLVTAGTQLRITYGTAPGASATVYVGLEMLKKVGS